MKSKINLKKLSTFDLDEYGRITVNDELLQTSISGAYLDNIVLGTDNGCHDNAACGDAGCSNGCG